MADQTNRPPEDDDLTVREDEAEGFEDEVDAAEAEAAADDDGEAPAAPREHPGEAQVIRLGQAPEAAVESTDPADDMPGFILKVFTERGAKSTGESYAGHMRRFLTWAVVQNLDVRTMPPDTAARYLEEAYPNPATRAQASVALRSCYDLAATFGVEVARQEVPRIQRPKKEKPPKAATNGHANGSAAHAEQPAPAVDVATGPEVPHTSGVAVSVPNAGVATRRAAPAAPNRRGNAVIPSLGQRIRISKRTTGSEGLGVPVGSMVLVGDYSAADIEGEGRLESFIANQIRPVYGPFANERATVYFVDRLDNIGNPIQGSTVQIPIMPDPNLPGPHGHASQPQQQPQAVAPSSGITGDKMLDYIISEQRRREEEAARRIAAIETEAKSKGMDPTMLMILLDRVKPEPLDVKALVAEFKKANPDPEPEPVRDIMRDVRDMRGPVGPLGGFDFGPMPTPEPVKPDATVEMLGKMMEQQNNLLTSLLTRVLAPPPPAPVAPVAPQKDPLETALMLVKVMQEGRQAPPPAPPEDPLRAKLLDVALTKMLNPEKPKTIAEVIAEVAALREASEMLGGEPEEKPLSLMDVIAGAVENAPKIGEAIGSVLAAMPRAPALPQPGQHPQRRATDARPAAALPPGASALPQNQTKAAPMPMEAKQAFIALAKATDEQEIVNHLFTILTACHTSGTDPWPLFAQRLLTDFQKCDTKVEIRAVVTNLFTLAGAKKLMTEENVSRITDTLHTHYALIYGQLTGGQEKTLKDAAPAPETVQPVETADEAASASADEQPVYEEEAEPAASVTV